MLRFGRSVAALLALAVPLECDSADADPYGNWFNDPFVEVRSAVADCPEPKGPLMHRSEMKNEEHYRVERGTSCWLAHQCDKPNAYQYDEGIAKRLVDRFRATAEFADTTLWITVQRRFVFVNGCGSGSDLSQRLERFVRTDPEVELALVDLARDPHGKIPYKVKPG